MPFFSGWKFSYGNVRTLCSDRRWRTGTMCRRMQRPIRIDVRGDDNIARRAQHRRGGRQSERTAVDSKGEMKSSKVQVRRGRNSETDWIIRCAFRNERL